MQLFRTINSNLAHTVNNCFRVTPGASVLVRAVATLWGTAVNFPLQGAKLYMTIMQKWQTLHLKLEVEHYL